ncbi:trypsin [Xenopus laevis]|uniref:Trypsin n=2 Tax=Xenopus laevis TaxID=8355 RepID=A0A1L8FPS5_XENLA|nr:trypsin [Xenopus laevis]OCT73580.1 hypothetical protein XELAEV_18036559mg [Xenopus laevis]
MESFCLLLLAVTHLGQASSQTGVLEKRIIGGKECVANSQPWHVSLFYFDDYICGGTLISKHWVLTAAHCLKPNILMQLGEHNLEVNEGNEQFAHTAIFCPHPKYDSVTYDNDIMLLKLNAPAKLNKYVQTISIGCPEVSSGTECTIAGWGSTTSIVETYPNILHCGTVTTETQDECQRLHSDLKITDNMLCASIAGETMDTCYGDSGGSLVCNSVVHGVTSFGHTTCGTGTKPGVYTKVCKYRDWIRKTVAKGDCL